MSALAPIRPALRDEAADAQLREHGFAVVPFPEGTELVAALLEAYGTLHGWDGSGYFEPDLTNPDRGYRREVSATLSAALDEAVGDRYLDARPFLRNFLCKWPGPSSDLYLHRDWMYIDEASGGRTYVNWIPLVDVTEETGPLQVLRGSHRFDPSLRGTNLNGPWIEHQDVIRPRLETVLARVGEMVIMDNALLHSSLPNESGNPRLVAAIGMRPSDAPLVHYLARTDTTAARYDIDEDFFLTITPQELMATPPELPVAAEVPAEQAGLTPDELATALDELGARVPAEGSPTPAAPEPDEPDAGTRRGGARPGVVARLRARWSRR